jgi:hypothetical protein
VTKYPRQWTHKEEKVIVVYGFRGFSPWTPGSVLWASGKAEHHDREYEVAEVAHHMEPGSRERKRKHLES